MTDADAEGTKGARSYPGHTTDRQTDRRTEKATDKEKEGKTEWHTALERRKENLASSEIHMTVRSPVKTDRQTDRQIERRKRSIGLLPMPVTSRACCPSPLDLRYLIHNSLAVHMKTATHTHTRTPTPVSAPLRIQRETTKRKTSSAHPGPHDPLDHIILVCQLSSRAARAGVRHRWEGEEAGPRLHTRVGRGTGGPIAADAGGHHRWDGGGEGGRLRTRVERGKGEWSPGLVAVGGDQGWAAALGLACSCHPRGQWRSPLREGRRSLRAGKPRNEPSFSTRTEAGERGGSWRGFRRK
mmetsp:Transcript_16745/g.40167  ORF Transcript_16745/g.40167 Transcript_16745/m.40167 type:complete len:298 (+) Transcript_16745:559-1452(+)